MIRRFRHIEHNNTVLLIHTPSFTCIFPASVPFYQSPHSAGRPDPSLLHLSRPVMPKIHVLHENPDWLPPLAATLDRTGAEWAEWFLVERAPELGSASCRERGCQDV